METISIRIPNLPIPAINCVLSFRPYLRYIEEQIESTPSQVYKTYLQSIAGLLKENPELLQPITDYRILDKHQELIELIKITHVSQVKSDENLVSLGIPSGTPPHINYFGYSKEFGKFFNERGPSLRLNSKEVGEEFQRNTYRNILWKSYGIGTAVDTTEAMLQLSYEENNIKYYYKVIRRHLFADVTTKNDPPIVRQEWVDYAAGIIPTHAEIKEPLPFERFHIEGFFIFSILPETENIALNDLAKTVSDIHVSSATASIEKLKSSTLSLLGTPNVDVGFLAFLKVNDKYVYNDNYATVSLIFGKLKKHFSSEQLTEVYEGIVQNTLKYSTTLSSIHNDLCEIEGECSAAVEHVRLILEKEGISAMKFIPVWHNDVLLGVIEIGSRHESDITIEVLSKLNAAIPAYREFFIYKMNSVYAYMNSFVMERYTSIQKSVAWKFNEEVWNSLKNITGPGDVISTPPVKFENLYPFYGAVDFRNSSMKQLDAIRADYKTQLEYLDSLIPVEMENDATVHEFQVKLKFWLDELANSKDLVEESSLRQLLERESLSFIDYLSSEGKIDAAVVKSYINALSSKFGTFHVFHNMYEESIQELNKVLREELFQGEVELQEKVPHYFEKFQTDGIEYSLYAGKNINPALPFPADAIDTIIEWQLNVMLKMEKAAREHSKYLSVPLETTQLILVHENMVDISYRIDERHFDVEGSYSIRYQVLKKRIDKVRIAGSNERLTQPGTIAIVYSNPGSIDGYLSKIGKLISTGKIHTDIEYHELEQLQGIGRMKAIRIKINTTGKELVKDKLSDIVTLH